MAFEQLYKFVDMQVEEYQRNEKSGGDGIYRQFAILDSLINYYNTVLAHPKFKDQRAYCRKKIFEINKPYATGYFGSQKS